MKHAQFSMYGDTNTISVGDTETPTLLPNQVLVEVKAASLNRIDSAIRKGFLQQMLPITLPATLGGDFAGIVLEVGADVQGYAVNDEVYGNAGHLKKGQGALAQVIAIGTDYISKKPKSLDFASAAALPLSGASALQAIEEELHVMEGQKILIQGGAGGVGSYAIQLAKLHGAHVATTVATDDISYAKTLGADEVIDYKTQDVTAILKDIDGVLDNAGGENATKLMSVLKKDGTLVSLAGQPDKDTAAKMGIRVVAQMTHVSSDQLKRLAELADAGKISVHIEKKFPLDQAKEAFEFFETQHPRGKVVIEIS